MTGTFCVTQSIQKHNWVLLTENYKAGIVWGNSWLPFGAGEFMSCPRVCVQFHAIRHTLLHHTVAHSLHFSLKSCYTLGISKKIHKKV